MWTVAFFVILAVALVCQFQVYRALWGDVVSHFSAWFWAAIICAVLLLLTGMRT